MEAILHDHEIQIPSRDLIVALSEKFSQSAERAGKMIVQVKQGSERKNSREPDKHDYEDGGEDRFESTDKEDESLPVVQLPQMSDSSLLLYERTRRFVYVSLPALAKGRKWVLLYSTWRHGISLSILYRRSMLCDGLSLLVVGDRKGAVFGGLVEAPLRPSKSRKYQGSNSTFLFTDMPGLPCIHHPTGANRYFTLCSPDFLTLGAKKLSQDLYDHFLKQIVDDDIELATYFDAAEFFLHEGDDFIDLYKCVDDTVVDQRRKDYELSKLQLRIGMNVLHIHRMFSNADRLEMSRPWMYGDPFTL